MFLLFAGQFFYASGGMNDYDGSFNTLKEAQIRAAYLLSVDEDWYQIVDKSTMAVVDKSQKQAYR